VNLAGAAAAFQELAERAEASLAIDCARAMAEPALAALKAATPVRSGHLRGSETVDAVSGTGVFATAVLSPHAIYAEFREKGGTITVKNARVLTDGTSFFGKSVTQAGSHYMEKGEAAGRGPAHEAAVEVVAEFFTL
jgi:predicted RNA methylase